MNHIGTRELSSECLTLRRFELEDADAIFYNWAKDTETAKYCDWTICETPEDAYDLLSGWINAYDRSDYYLWAIEVNDLEQPVGAIKVCSYNDPAMSAEIECWIGSDFIQQGIGREAAEMVLQFLTSEVGARRVWGKCDSNNDGGAKLMVRLGMEFEGTLKKAAKYNSGIVDVSVFGTVFYEDEETSSSSEENTQKTNASIKVFGEDGLLHNQVSDEVMEYVGILAKLELSPEEMISAKKDMEEMLDYIDQLDELDTTGIEPMSHVFAVNNAFREDVIINDDGTAATLKNAPVEKYGGFKVPKTIGE